MYETISMIVFYPNFGTQVNNRCIKHIFFMTWMYFSVMVSQLQ